MSFPAIRRLNGPARTRIVLGASTAPPVPRRGALDEILVCIAPVMLGDGTRLFDRLGGDRVRLERVSLSEGPQATNLWWRVVR